MIWGIVFVIGLIAVYTFDAFNDKVLSAKEALIRSMRVRLKEEDQIPNDLKEKNKWHKFQFAQNASFAILFAIMYPTTILGKLCLIGVIGALKIVYFNPLIAKRLGASFFHIGDGFIESKFKGKEKLYYAINAFIFIVCILYLSIEIF